jgi:hypothetical protein
MLDIVNILKPEIIFWVIPLIVIVLFLIFKEFVKNDLEEKDQRKKFKIALVLTRSMIFLLLLVALAQPFGETEVVTAASPKLTILYDNSTSMQIYNQESINKFIEELEKKMPVNVKLVGENLNSNIGERIISNLEENTNILVISDGNINKGSSLSEAALLARSLNSTISSVSLDDQEKEIGVYLTGPDKIVAETETTYTANIINTANQIVTLEVYLEDELILAKETTEKQVSFTKSFPKGQHKLTAKISGSEDYFDNNNIFYKTISTVEQPKVLLIMDGTAPVEKILNSLYDVTKTNKIPENVDEYYAVIVYDKEANIPGVERLSDYLINEKGDYYGNGLVVIGGFDSYDRGNYKNSILESYLPVYVGKAARQRGSSNIVLAIDFSGSTGTRIIVERDPVTGVTTMRNETSNIRAVQKALGISLINTLGVDNKVGVSIFSTQSATVSELKPLFKNKEEIIDKIGRIDQPPGQSYFHIGLSGAYSLLENNAGSSNIILVTDGNTLNPSIRKATIDTAKTLNARGVKVYVVGTGRNVDEEFLKTVAYNGGGIYIPADQQNRLRILFGEPEESKFGEVFDLFTLNPYHYITKDLDLEASLYGFNQVIPRPSSQQLVTTQRGEPAVTIWNYGLGRVASTNVFSGNNNLGDLLNSKNSLLITRTVNWAIGDPQRKESYYVTIDDARINEEVKVIVKSNSYPQTEQVKLIKTSDNIYQGSTEPQEIGFQTLIGKHYAINYETEYQSVGKKAELEEAAIMSGGEIFSTNQANEVLEFVKSVSKRKRTERTTIIWPFITLATIIFLFDIYLRKLREKKISN